MDTVIDNLRYWCNRAKEAERREKVAIDLMRGKCFACRTYKTCLNRRGPHKNCWLYMWNKNGPQEPRKGRD